MMLKSWIRRRMARIPPAFRPGPAYAAAAALAGAAAYGAVGWLFFEWWPAAAAAALAGAAASLSRTEAYAERAKRLAAAQFEQMLFSVASSLQAGKSPENALRDAEADLARIYGGGESALIRELRRLNAAAAHGVPLEKAVDEFSEALQIREIGDWADMFRTCRRTGGDMVKVMRETARAIAGKMNLEREWSVLIAAKRFEARALSVVPFLMIALFRYGSPDYMEPLYRGGPGRAVMGAALAMLLAGIYLAGRIMRFGD